MACAPELNEILSKLNIHENLEQMVAEYLTQMETEMEDDHRRADEVVKHDLIRRTRLLNRTLEVKEMVETVIESFHSNFQRKGKKNQLKIENFVNDLKKYCSEIYELELYDRDGIFSVSNRVLNEVVVLKKLLFNDCTLIKLKLTNVTRNRMDPYYLCTLIRIDCFLDDFEVKALSDLIKNGMSFL